MDKSISHKRMENVVFGIFAKEKASKDFCTPCSVSK